MRYNDLSTQKHMYSPDIPPHGSLLESARNQSYEILPQVAKPKAVLFSFSDIICLHFGNPPAGWDVCEQEEVGEAPEIPGGRSQRGTDSWQSISQSE